MRKPEPVDLIEQTYIREFDGEVATLRGGKLKNPYKNGHYVFVCHCSMFKIFEISGAAGAWRWIFQLNRWKISLPVGQQISHHQPSIDTRCVWDKHL